MYKEFLDFGRRLNNVPKALLFLFFLLKHLILKEPYVTLGQTHQT